MSDSSHDPLDRRPIATREKKLSKLVASRLARAGLSPNAISAIGMLCGLAAGAAFLATGHVPQLARPAWIAGAVLVQLRLVANMLDGMVALETGKTSPVGELWNEVPDRVSDSATLVGLGYAMHSSVELGWAAALVAMLTAYVRATGKAAGAPQEFCGPMAKPHRMFLVTLVALYCGLAPGAWHPAGAWGLPAWGLLVVVLGSLLTAGRRLRRMAGRLRTP